MVLLSMKSAMCLPQLAGAAYVGIFTPTVPVYVAVLSAILRIERFTLLKVRQFDLANSNRQRSCPLRCCISPLEISRCAGYVLDALQRG